MYSTSAIHIEYSQAIDNVVEDTQNLAMLGQVHTIVVSKESSFLLISNNVNVLVKHFAIIGHTSNLLLVPPVSSETWDGQGVETAPFHT